MDANPAQLEEHHPRQRADRNLLEHEPREKGIAVSVSIKPLEDRVVVKQMEAETVAASGLVIPDTAREKPQENTIVAVGPGRADDKSVCTPMDIKEGDKVVYAGHGGAEVKYQGEKYIILLARDLLVVVE